MARISLLTGLALIALGVLVTVASDSQSVTSLIPAFIGVVYLALGIAGSAKPAINHHLMHGAAALSLLAILGSLGSLLGRGSEGWAAVAQVGTVLISGVFLALAIRSFRTARRSRESTSVAA